VVLVPLVREENDPAGQTALAIVQISEPFAVRRAAVEVLKEIACALRPPFPAELLMFHPAELASSIEIPPAESMEIFPGLMF
jgi:hypothetical protein